MMELKKKLQESDFLELIQKCQQIIDQYPKNQNEKISTVLLLGLTGSGKSTIFNFLSGANFQIQDHEMVITNNSATYSQMNEGIPNFYKNQQNKHLIIDFPGYRDTNGAYDQLLIDLLFNKIVTSGPIKLIYVLRNPCNTLPNRGCDLQQFMKQLKNPKFDLLLNYYYKDLTDEELINGIKKQLVMAKLTDSINKILVLRKATSSSLHEIFNNNTRNMLWNEIEQVQENTFCPQSVPQSEKISLYINEQSLQIINEYLVLLLENFDQKYRNLSENNTEDILKNKQELLDFVKKENKETPLQWYLKFISICEKIAMNLEIKSDVMENSKSFIIIFKYFEQFSNLISGYQNLDFITKISKNKLKSLEELFNTKTDYLRKKLILFFDQKIQKLSVEKEEIEKELIKLKLQKQQMISLIK